MKKKSCQTEKKFSCGENLLATTEIGETTLKDLHERITNNNSLKKLTLDVRAVEKDQYRKKKLELPYILPSGIFSKRSNSGLINHSGYICIDVDKIDNIEEVKGQLCSLAFVNLAFTSPSSKGVKAIIKIDIEKATHMQYFTALEVCLQEEYHIEIDSSCKNVSRACLICHDSEAYINDHSDTLSIDFVNEYCGSETTLDNEVAIHESSEEIEILSIKLTKQFVTRKRIQIVSKAKSKIAKAKDGSKHITLRDQAVYFGFHIRYGLFKKEEAFDALSEAISLRNIESFEDAKKTINNGIQYGIKNAPSSEELGLVNSPEIYYIGLGAKDKPAVHIPYIYIYRFLNSHGFWTYKKDKTRIFIHVENNIITQIDKFDIIQFVLKYIKSLPWEIDDGISRDDIEEAFRKRMNLLFSENQLSTFNLFLPVFNKDDEYTAYYYYKNGFLKVTENDMVLLPYSELDKNIWNSQILDRDFVAQSLSDDELIKQSEFIQFLLGVSDNTKNENEERFQSLRTIIGYLLNNYKSPSSSKAIIFCDEKLTQSPEGSTGKGIVLKAISKFQNCALIDGKNFTFSSQFALQQVNLDTQLIVFEDVIAKFDFERLFSIITEGVSVEKKNKDKFFIPYSEAPKIVITTNYTIEGQGSSHQRRRVEYEFSQNYNLQYTPRDQFGHNLYMDWDDFQWQLFNQFMMQNVQLFLKTGIIEPPQINIAKRKLLQSTGEEFVVFCEAYMPAYLNKETCKADLRDLFTRDFPEFQDYRWFSQRLFNRWLRSYAAVYNLECIERVSNNNQLILIKK